MSIILAWLKGSAVWLIVIVALLTAIGVQQVRVAGLQTDLAQEKQGRSEDSGRHLQASLAWQAYVDGLRNEHATKQQLKETQYANTIKKLEAERIAAVADADSLRDDLAAYVAGAGRKSGESDASAYQRAADRLNIVATILAEGIGLVAESEGIIKGRDAEVANLLEQIRIDRAACSATR